MPCRTSGSASHNLINDFHLSPLHNLLAFILVSPIPEQTRFRTVALRTRTMVPVEPISLTMGIAVLFSTRIECFKAAESVEQNFERLLLKLDT